MTFKETRQTKSDFQYLRVQFYGLRQIDKELFFKTVYPQIRTQFAIQVGPLVFDLKQRIRYQIRSLIDRRDHELY